MKSTVNSKDDSAMEAAVQVGMSSTFQLNGDTYVLIEASLDHRVRPQHHFPGATDIGHCTMHGKTYAVLKLTPALDPSQDLLATLTERELEIATLVALGWPNKQIADHLHISEWTVSTHLRRIFAKLGVHNRAAMVYRCLALPSLGNPHK